MKVTVVLIFLLTIGCAGAPKSAAAPPTSAIIFVPGYYGSALKKASGERFFLTAGRYLFGSDAVSLHVADLATPPAPALVVDGVMDKVRVVPLLYSFDVYGEFMTTLSKMADRRHALFVPFAYDWRQDLSETAARLGETIRGLRERGIVDVEIVAHSMGCLISTYYLGYGAQTPEAAQLNWAGVALVDRVVLMGGPYRGAFSLFRNMQTGASIGSNTSYLPAETVASLPASYQLLPMLDFHLLDPTGVPTSFEIENVAPWARMKLGLLKDQTLAPELKERRRDFVAAQLARARRFATLLEFRGGTAPENLRVLQLVGRGHAVVDGAYFDPATETFIFDTDPAAKTRLRPLFRDGDGSVTLESSRLPGAFAARARILTTRLVHDRLFDDEAFGQTLKEFSK